jgi:hypothetical protein
MDKWRKESALLGLDYVDQNGKWRQKSFKTKEEATKEYTTILYQLLSGTHVADRYSITTEEA